VHNTWLAFLSNAKKPGEGNMIKSFATAAVLGAAAGAFIAILYCGGGKERCDCPPSKFESGAYFSERYEDYILGYVFKDVNKGFYIDVGANDPNVDNITRYFYERGWNGINIEPNVDLFEEIVRCRPRDSNYNVGIADREGTMVFYQQTDSGLQGLSTFDKEISEREKKENGFHFKETSVPVTTLDKILGKASWPAITFITIDVEGFEKQVIESIDLVKYRPAALCIEAMLPATKIPSYAAWEKIVLESDYLFAMFDGVNRYYVHRDHAALLPRFVFIERCVKKSRSPDFRKRCQAFLKKLKRKLKRIKGN
jgi:FkbM family methyltransferase